ncbi:hypothetical protein B0H10DRAFT_1957281 [Mycena sp. CBHHK59/15]|nr:hypothetical protein B0H10DRAFT_1957281 [Mycena sp. CBHHK59/15]
MPRSSRDVAAVRRRDARRHPRREPGACRFNFIVLKPAGRTGSGAKLDRLGPRRRRTNPCRQARDGRTSTLAAALGAFLQAADKVIPLHYMTSYSVSVLSDSASIPSLPATDSAVNCVSRLVMDLLVHTIGQQNTMINRWPRVILSALSAFVVLYSVYSGGYNALLATAISDMRTSHAPELAEGRCRIRATWATK